MPKTYRDQNHAQSTIVDFANKHNKVLLYGGTGLGKTLAALKWLETIDGLKVIITPLSTIVSDVWNDDYSRFFVQKNNMLVVLNKSTSSEKQRIVDGIDYKSNTTIVVNYESAYRMRWSHLPIQAVVVDECHRLKQYNGKMSLYFADEFKDVDRKIAMTGTPFDDGLEALYGITRWLFPVKSSGKGHIKNKLYGHYNDFLDAYCVTYNITRNIRAISGYKNVQQLMESIKPFTLKIETSEVIDLPNVVNYNYYADMSGKWKNAYEQLEEHSAVEMDDYLSFAPHILTKIIRLQQLANNGQLTTTEGDIVAFKPISRLNIVKTLLSDISGPVVIFTRFKRDIELLDEIIDEPCSYLTGSLDNHDNWKQGETRILLANITSGSEGVRLERASHIIFWSIGWSLKDYQQALGRIRRAGQKSNTVIYHHILTKDTIDEKIYNVLQKKATIRNDATKNL